MKYFIIFAIVIVLCIILFFLYRNIKRKQQPLHVESAVEEIPDDPICINYLTNDSIDDNSLVEIKDQKVLAVLDNLVVGGGKTIKEINDSAKNIYEVVIPKGAKLVKSKDKTIKNAVRGMYRDSKGYKGHANLVNVNKTQAIVSSTMSVASVIVGQYYMSEISNELNSINDNIEKVSNFQTDEYKGKLMTIMEEVNGILEYKEEIINNDLTRELKLGNLETLGMRCRDLHNQACLSIDSLINKKDLSYEEYEKKIKEINEWYVYQGYLLDLLEQVDNLKYTLYMGELSHEMCLDQYEKQKIVAKKIQQKLLNWHNEMFNKLKIDITSERIKKSGMSKFLYYLPGLINDDLNYNQLPHNVVNIIKKQSNEMIVPKKEIIDLYDKELKIVHKDNKTYFYQNNKK